jgi:tetratricopeptide (TPR) repeat protein
MEIGAAYIYQGRYPDAITVLRQSIELRPTSGALSNLGSTYLRLRRFPEAIPVFEQAIQLFPRNYIFHGHLARAYYWAPGEREKAVAAFQRAIDLGLDELRVNARSADAHIMLARYYAMLGKRTESLSHLSSALALRPTEAEYFSIAAVVQNQLGDRASTLSALRKAVDLGWSPAEIQSEVEFDNLRQETEFQKIIQK